MRLVALTLALFLFGCKTTKRIESLKVSDSIELKTEQKSELFEIKRKNGITELITETTVTRSIPHKKESGEEVILQEQTTEKVTERFVSNEETENKSIQTDTKQDSKNLSVENSFQRETEGQEVVKDLSKGITEGLFRSIFGDTIQKITGVILISGFILFLFFIRKKKVKDENRDQSSPQ